MPPRCHEVYEVLGNTMMTRNTQGPYSYSAYYPVTNFKNHEKYNNDKCYNRKLHGAVRAYNVGVIT